VRRIKIVGSPVRAGELKGAWAWLNFHYEPWESDGSAYFGAAVAAIAVGTPHSGNYAANPEIQERQLKPCCAITWQQGAELPNTYSSKPRQWFYGPSFRSFPRYYIDPTPGNHRGAFGKQHEDGGWSLSDLGAWKRADSTPLGNIERWLCHRFDRACASQRWSSAF